MKYTLFDYNIKIFKDEEDDDFIAYIEEIPDVSAFGDTPADAINELNTAFSGWEKTMEKHNSLIPAPFKHRHYSGRLHLRMTPDMHRLLAEEAEREKISLNQEILLCLAMELERKRQRKFQ